MNTRYALYGGLGVLALLLLSRKSTPDSIDRWGNVIHRDTSLLIPSFAKRVSTLMSRMRSRGFNPELYETYRTPERAAKLASLPEHTGVVKSMHVIGAAVDVIDADKKWSNSAFFKALGEEAEKLGLVWGGKFSDYDGPHVQAVPINLQTKLGNMAENLRDPFLRGLYA